MFKNTQPDCPNWDILGLMKNSWYKVKGEITKNPNANSNSDSDSVLVSRLFYYVVEPGIGGGGWMKPSAGNVISRVK